mmetsp:Transcript_19452/g.46917  ORF Transcript_19452/g.46917 Transcript_19452/m.46917 type:complete len:432 (+) Transcript_19452:760-2055(+)
MRTNLNPPTWTSRLSNTSNRVLVVVPVVPIQAWTPSHSGTNLGFSKSSLRSGNCSNKGCLARYAARAGMPGDAAEISINFITKALMSMTCSARPMSSCVCRTATSTGTNRGCKLSQKPMCTHFSRAAQFAVTPSITSGFLCCSFLRSSASVNVPRCAPVNPGVSSGVILGLQEHRGTRLPRSGTRANSGIFDGKDLLALLRADGRTASRSNVAFTIGCSMGLGPPKMKAWSNACTASRTRSHAKWTTQVATCVSTKPSRSSTCCHSTWAPPRLRTSFHMYAEATSAASWSSCKPRALDDAGEPLESTPNAARHFWMLVRTSSAHGSRTVSVASLDSRQALNSRLSSDCFLCGLLTSRCVSTTSFHDVVEQALKKVRPSCAATTRAVSPGKASSTATSSGGGSVCTGSLTIVSAMAVDALGRRDTSALANWT